MARRFAAVSVLLAGVAAGSLVARAELRPAVERPEIIEIGDPVIVSHQAVDREMSRNVELRNYIDLYGWPDYAEIQEVQIQEPFAPYEVRLYYLRRDRYLAFGRVHVAPSVYDYGVRKYEGPIRPETLDRLLTAQAVTEVESVPAAATIPEAATQEEPVAAETSETVESDEQPAALAEAPQVQASDEGVPAAVLRLEAAADRAALSAGLAERASLAAKESADRATSTLERVIQAHSE